MQNDRRIIAEGLLDNARIILQYANGLGSFEERNAAVKAFSEFLNTLDRAMKSRHLLGTDWNKVLERSPLREDRHLGNIIQSLKAVGEDSGDALFWAEALRGDVEAYKADPEGYFSRPVQIQSAQASPQVRPRGFDHE